MRNKRRTLSTKAAKAQGAYSADMNQQGALALLTATFDFLAHNKVSYETISAFAVNRPRKSDRKRNDRMYQELIRAYEDMGVIMATWYSHPKFLNERGNPRPLNTKRGPGSLANLIRSAGVSVKTSLALDLLTQSPSVKTNANGDIFALRRVFVLPGFEVPRAALFVSRYLNTLQRNALGRNTKTNLLLERSCHVSEIKMETLAPVLRDIKGRGSAFIDSIDGDIEAQRTKGTKRKGVGELGVLVFAWTSPSSAVV